MVDNRPISRRRKRTNSSEDESAILAPHASSLRSALHRKQSSLVINGLLDAMDIDSQPKEDMPSSSSRFGPRKLKRKHLGVGNVAAAPSAVGLAVTESQATVLDEEEVHGRKKRMKKESSLVVTPMEAWAGISEASSNKRKGKERAMVAAPAVDESQDDTPCDPPVVKKKAGPKLTSMQQAMADKLEGSRFR